MQLKWTHLFESDARNRDLYRKWQETGNERDAEIWLRAEKRSGKGAARAFAPHVPARVENVREDVETYAGRTLFVFAWADREEEEGRHHSGQDFMDEAPPAPRKALRAGRALIKRIESLNRLDINKLYWIAANMPGRHYKDPDPEDFGFGLAAAALGHGVGWDDYHPDPGIELPHWDYQL